MSTVAEWSERFGHIDPYEKKARRSFSWDYKVAYCCEVAEAKIAVSQRGDTQLKLTLKVLGGDYDDAQEIGRADEFYTLPKQESDLKLADDLVKKIHRRRTLDILRILSAAEPETYNLYKRAEGDGKQKVFFGYDGKPMDSDAFARRERSTHADCELWVEKAHESVGDTIHEFEGVRLYIEKVRNPKSDKYPYTNLYANLPPRVPVYSKGEDAPF